LRNFAFSFVKYLFRLSGVQSYLSVVVCYWLLTFGCRALTVNCRVSLLVVFCCFIGCRFRLLPVDCRVSLSEDFVVSLFRVSSPNADYWLSDVSVGGFCCFVVFGCRCRVFAVDCQFRVLTVDCRVSLSEDVVVSWFSGVVVGCWLLIVGVGVGGVKCGFLQILLPWGLGIGIGLSYRLGRLHKLAKSIPWNRFQGSLKV
jgi:hypothetical protein